MGSHQRLRGVRSRAAAEAAATENIERENAREKEENPFAFGAAGRAFRCARDRAVARGGGSRDLTWKARDILGPNRSRRTETGPERDALAPGTPSPQRASSPRILALKPSACLLDI